MLSKTGCVKSTWYKSCYHYRWSPTAGSAWTWATSTEAPRGGLRGTQSLSLKSSTVRWKYLEMFLNAISGKSKMSLSCLFFVQDNCKPLLQNEHQPHLQHQWSQRRNPKDWVQPSEHNLRKSSATGIFISYPILTEKFLPAKIWLKQNYFRNSNFGVINDFFKAQGLKWKPSIGNDRIYCKKTRNRIDRKLPTSSIRTPCKNLLLFPGLNVNHFF